MAQQSESGPSTMSTSVGFVGLGAMGFGMACNLQKGGKYTVKGYDVWQPSVERFVADGGHPGQSPRDVAHNSAFLVCMAANAQQVDSILFDAATGALEALPHNATILLCSTVPPAYYDTLAPRIAQVGRSDILIVDCPVSGGTVRAAHGTLTIFASGSSEALARADQILHEMSEKLYEISGGPGAASKVKMVNQCLVGTHIAAAAEAMGLAEKAGLDTREVFEIIKNAAGNSWAFENRVPHMLDADWTPRSALDIFVKDMGIVVSSARSLQFPLPLASAAEQLYIWGSAQGYGREDDSGLVRVFQPNSPVANKDSDSAAPAAALANPTPVTTPLEISKVGMIGLGAMGQGMASSMMRGGFAVHGYDVYEPAIQKFVSGGGRASAATSPADAAKGAEVLVLMVQNATQATDALFGSGDAAAALPDDSIVILSSTVPPSFVRSLEKRLTGLGRGITLLDAPVSGGVVRAANGNLTIICSGDESTISKANGVLLSMTGLPTNLCQVKGGVGAASSVKLINQLLAGVHIAAAAEAMAFAARLGLDTRQIFELLKNAAAWSWMFENRVPQMLEADWTPHSALAIFVKDLGIVLDETKRLTYFAPMSSAAHTLYLAGAAKGWSREADAGVVRWWEGAGVSVSGSAGKPEPHAASEAVQAAAQPLPAKETLEALPAEFPLDVLESTKKYVDGGEAPILVVLDDDPTGTQTCHDIDVLMVWDVETLESQFERESRGFFILTNSRALPGPEARNLILEICDNVKEAAQRTNKRFDVVLRGDSTLRGHLPEEPEAVEQAMGKFDAWVLTPFFLQGGRYTLDDVHYVKEGDVLVPASQTPFAQDATFGYQNSNLRQYILEKCGSRFNESSFLSITIDDIRVGGPEGVKAKLLSRPAGSDGVVIVNAAAESDMDVFVSGLLAAEKEGRRYLYRTAAAFVSSRLGIKGIPPMSLADVQPPTASVSASSHAGGLILAGSYVPKTTAQLKVLRERRQDKLAVVELEVADLIKSAESERTIVDKAAAEANDQISAGKDILVMTSRTLVKTSDAISSLEIGSKVAAALVRLLEQIQVRPRYVIAKGGITSSDAATKGLRMRRARIMGQAAPGVPLWRCDEETSRHQGVPYVVFPGNVGSESTLAEIVESWAA
ncbi:hypothetical protein VD0002_g4074 [Verticillium dahliae]|uniref:3-hydroxyisobutyrate dehydrogenase n=2 Tax=Verticillium dahliae TaxID=27337 RepID=G2WZM6_VERDV|nr:3-hydroxyisobutyrate dehydrogenase [Verticillium dahliae VdLs.17]KAF3346612.1 Phosphoglucomutase [Verticillium dahliae VDG2]KAH6703871.1 3-hydroxyisobutyrate dehydrogenase [Verticillium dahliae]EGY22028.1 3-hydroxyisobutyrate dehydrogenase [Verticillium dahliae VdLs.17]PNH29061.1 hypothetical protein BJF96_g7620 [Verticillium dahliae]PNH53631.1 hypothetical protein VD0003_g3817 [Verticillium dahliae]